MRSIGAETASLQLRIACTSDLFDQTTKLVDSCPPADVLIIAGNLSRASRWSDLVKFRQCLADLPVKYKIFVPGSADLAFNLDKLTPAQASVQIFSTIEKIRSSRKQCDRETIRKELSALGHKHLSEYFGNLIYLEDRGVELFGVKFFGSPWVSSDRNATFFCSREKIMSKWNSIPRGIDVLITCQPPLGTLTFARVSLARQRCALGHGDADYAAEHLGDVDLLGRRERVYLRSIDRRILRQRDMSIRNEIPCLWLQSRRSVMT